MYNKIPIYAMPMPELPIIGQFPEWEEWDKIIKVGYGYGISCPEGKFGEVKVSPTWEYVSPDEKGMRIGGGEEYIEEEEIIFPELLEKVENIRRNIKENYVSPQEWEKKVEVWERGILDWWNEWVKLSPEQKIRYMIKDATIPDNWEMKCPKFPFHILGSRLAHFTRPWKKINLLKAVEITKPPIERNFV